jgi:CDP-diacylglycerol--glycerol-3-phosphate 3-phosphatidyltransferase
MISTYKIKPKFQAFLLPVLKFLHRCGVTANAITWSAIMLSVATGVICFFYPSKMMLVIIPISLFVRMALNALDGMMARIYQMQSKKGEILNELGDVVSDFIMFYPLGKIFDLDSNLLVAFLFLSLVNEYVGVLGKAVSGERRYEGPMGKSDRAFVVGLLCIFSLIFPICLTYSNYVFVFVCALLIVSTSIRIYKTLKINL